MEKRYQIDGADGSKPKGKSPETIATEALAQVKMLSKRVDMLMGVLGWDPGDMPSETSGVVSFLQHANRLARLQKLPTAETIVAFAGTLLHLTPEHLELFAELSGDPQPWVVLDVASQQLLDLLASVPPENAWGVHSVLQSARRNLRSAVYHHLAETKGSAQTLRLVPPPPFDDFHGGVLQVLLAKRRQSAR